MRKIISLKCWNTREVSTFETRHDTTMCPRIQPRPAPSRGGRGGRTFVVRLRVHLGAAGWAAAPSSREAHLHRACSCPATSPCAHIATVLSVLRAESDLPGNKEAGCPEAVHERALVWIRDGVIRRTTPAQRQGNHAANLVACPAEMLSLVAWGYVSPHYPWPPVGALAGLDGGLGVAAPRWVIQRRREIAQLWRKRTKGRAQTERERRQARWLIAKLPGFPGLP